MRNIGKLVGLPLVLIITSACLGSGQDGESEDPTSEDASVDGNQNFPDVIDVEVSLEEYLYAFEITISSPYDSPEQYANGWRIVALGGESDGEVLEEAYLAYHHADEQPFTLTQEDVTVNTHFIDEVTVEARDSINGYGGETQTVKIPTSW